MWSWSHLFTSPKPLLQRPPFITVIYQTQIGVKTRSLVSLHNMLLYLESRVCRNSACFLGLNSWACYISYSLSLPPPYSPPQLIHRGPIISFTMLSQAPDPFLVAPARESEEGRKAERKKALLKLSLPYYAAYVQLHNRVFICLLAFKIFKEGNSKTFKGSLSLQGI